MAPVHTKEPIRYEDAAERRTVEGWVCKACRRWWGEDEHMARWCCSTDQPCACGNRRTKHYTVCDSCREKAELERWLKKERRPYDGGFLYSDALSRYFDDADDVAADIAEAIGAVNDIIAQRRKDGRQISWFPSKYAVDLDSLNVEASIAKDSAAQSSDS